MRFSLQPASAAAALAVLLLCGTVRAEPADKLDGRRIEALLAAARPHLEKALGQRLDGLPSLRVTTPDQFLKTPAPDPDRQLRHNRWLSGRLGDHPGVCAGTPRPGIAS